MNQTSASSSRKITGTTLSELVVKNLIIKKHTRL